MIYYFILYLLIGFFCSIWFYYLKRKFFFLILVWKNLIDKLNKLWYIYFNVYNVLRNNVILYNFLKELIRFIFIDLEGYLYCDVGENENCR